MNPGQNTPAAKELLGYIERIESHRATIDDIKDDEKQVFAELKARGFNPKAVRHLLKVRKTDREGQKPAREALQSDIDIYAHSLGMEELPLFRHLQAGAKLADTAEKLLEHFKTICPEGDEIIAKLGGQAWRIWRDGEGEARAEPHVEKREAPGHSQPMGGAMPEEEAQPPAPDVTPEEARQMGAEAARKGEPVTSNPFKALSPQRREFDAGWQDASGSDGMGPDTQDQPKDKPARKAKPKKEDGKGGGNS